MKLGAGQELGADLQGINLRSKADEYNQCTMCDIPKD